MFRQQLVLGPAGLEFLGGVDEQHLLAVGLGLAVAQDQDAGRETGAVENVLTEADYRFEHDHPLTFITIPTTAPPWGSFRFKELRMPDNPLAANNAIGVAQTLGFEVYGLGIRDEHITYLLPHTSKVVNDLPDLVPAME